MPPLRTVIIDDDRYACERLKKLLHPFSQIEVEGYFTGSQKGLEFISKEKPDLLFLDVELEKNISAFDVIRQIRDFAHRPVIILVTAYPHYSIKAIKNEVFDYILKPVDVDELEDTIDRLMEHISLKTEDDSFEYKMLSDREKVILNFVLEGKSSREIADLLYISVNTVNTHRRNILKKTGARSFMDLIRAKHR
ncbi:MAG: DNA-binding response regulator [Bacteroidales bacterium]|nr:DNA-binding response regulator [Bacteroidales bacterium]